MSFANPFNPSSSKPGHGSIVLALLPPATPVLRTLSYQYPLKLIAPDPLTIHDAKSASSNLIHTVFLLTYGGGIVAGDTVDLHLSLDPRTHLTLLTQGSTKIFKTPDRTLLSHQVLTVNLLGNAALCYLPDPVQPFGQSAFEQRQTYTLDTLNESSLCVCDWVSQGRTARGENWSCHSYASRNEVWYAPKDGGKRRLLLRDNIILNDDGFISQELAERVDGLGVYGSLILRGPLFKALEKYFLDEFAALPRIGGRKWDGEHEPVPVSAEQEARLQRQKQETKDGVIWTAANVRGFVLLKFGAREVEGAKRWLHTMIKGQGDIPSRFGSGSLMCLR